MLSRRAVFLLFLVSGIAGLIYQVLWLRRLSLVFGVTVYAASTVLAAFMAGLAIGSLLSSRVLKRGHAPLAAFGAAEILVGVTGLASPWLLDAASSLYQALHRSAPESLTALTIARFVCSFAILAVPTAMMGITLPLLSEALRGQAVGARVSLLYAVNTAGATIGTLLAGFLFVPALGIQRTFVVAASLNVLVGVFALWLARSAGSTGSTGSTGSMGSTIALSARRIPIVLCVVVVLSGVAALGLEIVWFRLLLQFVNATTEAFTAMLATVLAGIALGGLIAAWILRAPRNHVLWLAYVQACTGVAAVGSMSFLLWAVERGWKVMGLWQAVILAIAPASLMMGVGFPLALGVATREGLEPAGRNDVARRVGTLYALNVAGAIAGSLGTGFLLLPWIGSVNALVALSALFAAAGVGVMLARGAGGLASAASPRTLASMAALCAVFVVIARGMPDPFEVAIDRRYGDVLREFWRDEGAQTAVSVRASRLQHVLYLDGLHQANDQPDMVRLHRAIGHLPMVLHGAPRDVLVVGMGGGATPGAVSRYRDASVQVVELSESVRRAAPIFAHINYDLLNRPNVSVRIDDGRNFLSLTDRRFDVITADIIQPGHAGAGHVYSREYFSLVRRALKDGGIVLQWIGHRPFLEYSMIMRTFLDVFPEATLWYDANFMVGTVEPLRIDPGGLDRLRQDARTRDALDSVGLESFDVLRSWYTAGPAEMKAFVGPGPLLTDDRPLVEYHHWLPSPGAQPRMDLSTLRGDVGSVIADGSGGER